MFFSSLSEYGCITNTRTFSGQAQALYGSKMTPVYSGGLVYEYSEEANKYGLVTIDGNTITEKPDFDALKTELAKAPTPQGDGGYNANGAASSCPADSSTWKLDKFQGSDLPAIPDSAKQYMQKGAGTGPGLAGDGSQNAGGASSGTATPGSGAVSTSGSKTSTSAGAAAGGVRAPGAQLHLAGVAPFVVTGVVFFGSLLGASLL